MTAENPFVFDAENGLLLAPSVFSDLEEWLGYGFGTRLASGWPGEGSSSYASLRQIHSDIVVPVRAAADDTTGPCDLGQGDALTTRDPGQWIGVRTADCVPVLIADPRHRAVAAVHSGWRGTVAQIAAKAVARMASEYGSRPGELRVAIGPAIGVCCYEVGTDVAAQFGAESVRQQQPRSAQGSPHVDLRKAIEKQLLNAGVSQQWLARTEECTRCDGTRYHSYRRDGDKAGRMVAAIRVRPSSINLAY